LGDTYTLTNALAVAYGLSNTTQIWENNNGVFRTNKQISINDIVDGTSNTALFSEAVLGDGDDNTSSAVGDWFSVGTSLITASASSPSTSTDADTYYTTATTTYSAAKIKADSALASPTFTGAAKQFSFSGRNFFAGNYVSSRYNHVVTPNKASLAADVTHSAYTDSNLNEGPTATTASSRHGGGVNVALADGSVKFVSDEVDKDAWRALGTIAGKETSTKTAF
jgi:prepilin-type processing-associated H-X9-DG protein